MQNLFEADNYPDQEPGELVVGNRWAWTRSEITAAYPVTNFTLKYRFSLQAEPFTTFEITADKASGSHVIEEAQTATGSYAAGDYRWQAVVVRDSDSDEVTVDQGYVSLALEFTTSVDQRSHVYRVLVAIRATIEGTATSDQGSYTIAGRSLERRSIDELMKLEREYSRRWEAEKVAQARKSGKPARSRVLVKMSA